MFVSQITILLRVQLRNHTSIYHGPACSLTFYGCRGSNSWTRFPYPELKYEGNTGYVIEYLLLMGNS
ncbi:hypothetical protein I7I53_02168 [Histoplasma capsulatum var. duboisii H88]|uniref:Uncharacterized protein n=1 Tax=Ajellomyces capsulatus (strain H88) TaxID=544711 RepID=A0A8A1LJR2_AJEC8|nr:hypothetical protein I7I53_02168 [Histoplasma capsulatum var. duboisii H88]